MRQRKEPNRLTAKEQGLESVQSEGFLKVYANSAQIETTVWDFKVIFGEMVRNGDKMVIEQSVAIVMSPQHLKAFVGVLTHNLHEYEKRVGEIKLPAADEAAETETLANHKAT